MVTSKELREEVVEKYVIEAEPAWGYIHITYSRSSNTGILSEDYSVFVCQRRRLIIVTFTLNNPPPY